METLYVTGSRLARADFEGGLPVDVYTSADMEKTTSLSLNNYLRTIPTSYGSDNVDEGYVNGGDGRATIGLRGLPTVTLVNGRRLVNGNLNSVPLVAVDRIEILKDGNGAVYGADAVGGVVNIITKKNFEGMMVTGSYQNTTDTDISRRRAEVVYGINRDKLSLVVGYSWFKQNDLFSIDRDSITNTSDRSFGATSAVPNPGRFVLNATQAQSMFGVAQANSYRVNNNVTVATSPADFRVGQYGVGPAETSDRFTFAIYTPTVRPATRRSVFGSVEYAFDEKFNLYFDLFHTKSESQAGLAPSPASFGTGGTNIAANNYWNQRVFGANAVNITSWTYRFVDFGPRNNDVTFDDTSITLGFRGDINPKLSYDISYFWNGEDQFDLERNGVNRARLAEVLQGLHPTFTGARSFNPFTNAFDSGVVSQDPEMLEYIKLEPGTARNYDVKLFNASLTGRPFELAAGDVEILGGYEYRKEDFDRIPDAAKLAAAGSGWNSTSRLSTSYNVKSVFAEGLVPIVADKPFMRRLQVGAAVRREEFSHLSDSATIGRVYLRNQFNRDLTLRASYSEGYTAPTPTDLSPAVIQSFPNLFMPWLGVADQANQGVILVGNANLEPTESKSYNAGIVWSPRALRGFSMTLDYYDAKQSNIIIQDPQLYIDAFNRGGGMTANTNGTFTKNNNAPFASQINVDADGSVTGIPGYIVQITDVQIQNIAELGAKGLDFELRYDLRTESAGAFTWRVSGTRVLSYEIDKLPGLLPTTEYDGFYTPNDSVGPETVPHWRGFVTMDWSLKNFGFNTKLNYVGKYLEDPDGGDNYTSTVKAWPTVDFMVSYTVPRTGTQIAIGLENAFDKAPPFAISSFADKYDRSAHNILGRLYNISVTQRF